MTGFAATNTPPGMRGNNQIKTHCRKGHPFSGSNLQFDTRGGVRCKTCSQDYLRKWGKRQKVVRPYIPYGVRVEVVWRQLVRAGLAQLVSKPRRQESGEWLRRQLRRLFGDEPYHLDHDPALVNRPFNQKTGRYTPAANDPAHLIYRTKADHDIKTRIRGDGAQHSDLALVRKRKRKERKAAKPKHKWPTRPMRSANRWPKTKEIRS